MSDFSSHNKMNKSIVERLASQTNGLTTGSYFSIAVRIDPIRKGLGNGYGRNALDTMIFCGWVHETFVFPADIEAPASFYVWFNDANGRYYAWWDHDPKGVMFHLRRNDETLGIGYDQPGYGASQANYAEV